MPRIRLVRRALVALVLSLAAMAVAAQAAEARLLEGLILGDQVNLERLDWNVKPDNYTECGGSHAKPHPPDRQGERFCYAAPLVPPVIGVSFRFKLTGGRYTDSGPYEVDGYALAPLLGDNTSWCEIRKLGSTHKDQRAPYRCALRWGPGSSQINPRPEWVVEPKRTVTVTDRDKQAKVIKDLCGDNLRTGACRYLPSTVLTDRTKPAVQAAAPFKNCTTGEAKHGFEVEEGFRTETSLDASVGLEAEFLGFMKASAEVKLGFKWETERIKRSTYEMSVEPGHSGSYWYEAAYDEITGDLELYGDDAIWVLPNVRYDFPTASGDLGTVTARMSKADCGPRSTPPVCLPRDDTDGTPVCSSATPAKLDPAWCLTDGFTDGTCPPAAAVSDLGVAWPTDWATTGGLQFVHWGDVGSGDPSPASCPAGSAAVPGAGSGSRRGDGRAQAWVTCRTDERASSGEPPAPSPAPVAPAPAPAPVSSPAPIATAARARSEAPRTVYLSLPLARRSDRHYHEMASAARLAFADHHARAGGRAVKLKVLSDADPRTGRWSADRARANARLAAHDANAVAFVGGATSGASAAAATILNRAGVLQVSPSSTALDLTTDRRLRPSGRRTFARIVPNDLNQADGLAQYMQQSSVTRVFVVQDGEDYGSDLAHLFRLAAPHHELQVIAVARAPRNGQEAHALARRIASSGASALLFAGLAENGARPLLRDLAAMDGRIRFFGGDGLADHEDFLLAARHDGFEQRLYLTSPALDPNTLPASGQTLYQRLWARAGQRPDPYAVNAYEAMSATLDAIGRAHGPRAATVRAFFTIRDRHSPLGTYSISRSGDTTLGSYAQYTVHDARLDPPLCVGC
jgi:branched-chain amino acid transport system substrate-binding protein